MSTIKEVRGRWAKIIKSSSACCWYTDMIGEYVKVISKPTLEHFRFCIGYAGRPIKKSDLLFRGVKQQMIKEDYELDGVYPKKRDTHTRG